MLQSASGNMSTSAGALPNAPLAATQPHASMHMYSCRSLHAEKEANMGVSQHRCYQSNKLRGFLPCPVHEHIGSIHLTGKLQGLACRVDGQSQRARELENEASTSASRTDVAVALVCLSFPSKLLSLRLPKDSSVQRRLCALQITKQTSAAHHCCSYCIFEAAASGTACLYCMSWALYIMTDRTNGIWHV